MKELTELRRENLEEYEFPGTDAAVLVIEEKIAENELKESWREYSVQHRFYPTETGWKIKFPYWDVVEICDGNESTNIEDFEREIKGWDHEHCSFCHQHIWIGDTSYTHDHEDGGFYIICSECYAQTE